MDPTQRLLNRITIADAIKADQDFSFLMGDDVQPRKDFISKNAKFVKNLDI
jgi:DNA gyrase subunit B